MTSSKNKRVCVTGFPGAGKSTIAMSLKEQGICAISTDEDGFCTWRDRVTGQKVVKTSQEDTDFMDKNRWICDITRLEQVMDESDETVVVCGVVSNQEEYMDLFDTVLLLQCRPEVLIRRLDERVDEHGKDKGVQQRILERQRKFEDEMLESGAIPIDAELPLIQVLNKVKSYL